MGRWTAAAIMLSAAMSAGGACAQPRDVPVRPKAMAKPMVATLYRDPGFAGPSITIDATQLFMETPWPVRSMRTRGDGEWQVCSDTLFEGKCMMVARDISDMRARTGWTESVESMRAICTTD